MIYVMFFCSDQYGEFWYGCFGWFVLCELGFELSDFDVQDFGEFVFIDVVLYVNDMFGELIGMISFLVVG